MSCYTCTHCNKCGMFSIKVAVVCKSCGAEVPAGAGACPACGGTSLARMDAKLRVHVFHVALHRVLRDDQLVGNVPDRSAAREQSEHLRLARRQLRLRSERRACAIEKRPRGFLGGVGLFGLCHRLVGSMPFGRTLT